MTDSGSKLHYGWVVLGAAAIIALGASGLRSMFGVFIKPMEAEFGWDRAALSGAAAVSILVMGAVGPFVGWLADRWGPRLVMVVSCVALGVGSVLASWITSLWQLYATVGLLMAAGGGGVGAGVAVSLVARWFETRRGMALGLLGGSQSAGQLIVIPLAVWVTLVGGWRQSFFWLGLGLLATALPIAFWLVRNEPSEMGLRPFGSQPRRSTAAGSAVDRRVGLAEALQVPAFWLLCATFFVCGYTTAGLVLTHLVPHAADHGFSEMHAAQALGVMGAMNIVGTVVSGWLCDRFGRKGPLASYYALRGVSLLFLPFVWSVPSLHVFAALFGLNFISTVPPTNALTANIFGRLSVGTLTGWIFFSHQAGGALGAAVAGWIFDATGSYTWAFVSGALLALVAAGLTLAIKEEPVGTAPTPDPRRSGVPIPAGGA